MRVDGLIWARRQPGGKWQRLGAWNRTNPVCAGFTKMRRHCHPRQRSRLLDLT